MNKADCIFSHSYRIYLEDTDAGGIVYHANHLKLFERCRRDWLRQLGMTSYFYAPYSAESLADRRGKNVVNAELHFVVSELTIRYIQPILLDSLVTVTVTTCLAKSASLALVQQIFDNDQLLASADITLACVQSTVLPNGKTQIKPARLPNDFLAMIAD